MAGHVEQDVTELVGEREGPRSGSHSCSIDDHDVSHARAVGVDERLADATGMRKARDQEYFDGRRIAVVERLDQAALLQRAGDGIEIGEVIEPVGEIDLPETNVRASDRVESGPPSSEESGTKPPSAWRTRTSTVRSAPGEVNALALIVAVSPTFAPLEPTDSRPLSACPCRAWSPERCLFPRGIGSRRRSRGLRDRSRPR